MKVSRVKWIPLFSIVSWYDSLEGKCRKMPCMDIQIVCQPARRPHGLAIPRAYRLRCADRRDRFQQRPGEQSQTDAPLQGCGRPSPWHLHGGAILRDKE